MQYQTEIYPEIHCDQCNEIVHNHFDCPICLSKYAATSIYGPFGDQFPKEPHFSCEECGAKFKVISFDPPYDLSIERVDIEPSRNQRR